MIPAGSDLSADAAIAARDRRRVTREALLLALAATLIAGVGVIGLWFAATHVIRDHYGHYLTSVAQAAALHVDPARHAQLRDPADLNGPAYEQAVAPLRRLLATLPDVSSIYTMVRDGDEVRFVLDAAPPGDADRDGIPDQAGLWEIYRDREPAMEAALGMHGTPGRAAVTGRPYADKWGTFMTGWAPLLDAEDHQYGALGVDVDDTVYFAVLDRARRWAWAGLAPVALLILMLTAGFHRLRLRCFTAMREKQRAERALDGERQRLGNIVEQIDIGTWETTIHGWGDYETRVDARWAAMLGRRAEDLNPLRAADFDSLVHPEDLAVVAASMEHSLATPAATLEFDVRMRHAEGQWVWTHVRGRIIEFDAQGCPQRMVGTQMDISARKAIESALQESESNLRSLFELSPLGISLCELPSGRFLKVNDAMLQFTGYSREELTAMTFWDLTPEQHHEAERALLQAASGAGSNFGPYEKESRRKDGTCYPVLISGLRVRDKLGRELGWAIVQDISKRKAMESELAAAANRDRLTGLANRTLFLQWLQRAIERVRDGRQRGFATLFLDFDRFKLVNDAMGHEAGDALLREIAARLRICLAAGEDPLDGDGRNLVARFGGDEFLVLLNDADAGSARRTAEDLLASLARPFLLKDREVFSTASIGIVTSEQCLESAEAVIRNADVAMYEAKRSGRACAVVFDAEMQARLTRYVTIDSQLRPALESDQLSLVYQPIVDLQSGRMTSVEALARWRHPTLGTISPAEFIPVAEESGLIVLLGERVLREACETLAAWRAQDIDRAPETICVNISRAELSLGRRLLQRVSDTLFAAGLPPQCLRLEVTERDAMRDPQATLQLMRDLRAMGVRLAMDDFGTGTSSLGCLRDYPFDVIKIDQSFVSDVTTSPEVLALIHAAVTLVQNLGKTSVAEGVETAEQRAILQSLGCEFGQGYYFSRPLTREEMSVFMASPRALRA